jgi:hypothetical protein
MRIINGKPLDFDLLRPLQGIGECDQNGVFLPDVIKQFESIGTHTIEYINHVACLDFKEDVQIKILFPTYEYAPCIYNGKSGMFIVKQEDSITGPHYCTLETLLDSRCYFIFREPIIEYGSLEEEKYSTFLANVHTWYSIYNTFIRMPIRFATEWARIEFAKTKAGELCKQHLGFELPIMWLPKSEHNNHYMCSELYAFSVNAGFDPIRIFEDPTKIAPVDFHKSAVLITIQQW